MGYLSELAEEVYRLKAEAEKACEEGNLRRSLELIAEAKIKLNEISDAVEEECIDLDELEEEASASIDEDDYDEEEDDDD